MKRYCIVCDQEIEKHDDFAETLDGPAHLECLDIDDADIDQ